MKKEAALATEHALMMEHVPERADAVDDPIADVVNDYEVEAAPPSSDRDACVDDERPGMCINDGISDAERDLLDAYDSFFSTSFPNADEKLESVHTAEGEDVPTVGMLVMMHLNWMDQYHASLTSAAHQWNALRSLLSHHDSKTAGLFSHIKTFVEKYRLQTVEKIDVCPCMATIYYDLTDQELAQEYPHVSNDGRTHCEKCGLSRTVRVKGKHKARKVLWYLPYR